MDNGSWQASLPDDVAARLVPMDDHLFWDGVFRASTSRGDRGDVPRPVRPVWRRRDVSRLVYGAQIGRRLPSGVGQVLVLGLCGIQGCMGVGHMLLVAGGNGHLYRVWAVEAERQERLGAGSIRCKACGLPTAAHIVTTCATTAPMERLAAV